MKIAALLAIFYSVSACSSTRCDFETVRFYGQDHVDSMDVVCQGKVYHFQAKGIAYDSIFGFSFDVEHENINPRSTKIITKRGAQFLLTMASPDFIGPYIELIDMNAAKPQITFTIQRRPVAIFDTKEGATYMALQKIPGDPGSYKGYITSEIPLFELYELKSDGIDLDNEASFRYNRQQLNDFEKISRMKHPVYGLKDGKRTIIDMENE